MSTSMSLSRFKQLLTAYGGDPRHWPQPERAAARLLLTQSAQARALQAKERQLDALLAQHPQTEPSTDLFARIMQAAVEPPPRWWQKLAAWWWPDEQTLPWWRPALTFALPLALGLWLGLQTASIPNAEPLWQSEAQLLALNWEEVSE